MSRFRCARFRVGTVLDPGHVHHPCIVVQAVDDAISAATAPTVSGLSIVLIALGALALANVLAAIPGWIAARTPTAVLLRTE
jgi:hypothetical protein